MTYLKRLLPVLALAVFVLGSTGCFQRHILDINERGGMTMMETEDSTHYVVVKVVKRVYWECQESANGLSCDQVCDREDADGDDVICPKHYTW